MYLHSFVSARRTASLTALLAVTGCAAILASAGPASADIGWPSGPAASVTSQAVHPDSGGSCGTGASSGNVNTCMTIIGSGLYVQSMTASAEVIDSTRTLSVCIYSLSYDNCSPWTVVTPGNTVQVQWSPNADEAAGTYCGDTYRLDNDGSYEQIGEQCVDVFA